MEDPLQLILSQPQKRPLEDEDAVPVSTPTKAPPSEAASTPLTILSTIPSPSPQKRPILQTAAPVSSNNSTSGDAPTQAEGTAKQPAKRRKLTPQEKEAKEKAKADLKAQKEEEKRLEEEEKQRKKEEREEKKRLQDEEKRRKREELEEKKRAKEHEQQQREEEKRKKERSQMKLGAFFNMKAKPAGEATGTTAVEAIQPTSAENILLEPEAKLTNANSAPASPQKVLKKNAKSDYEQVFLPFELPSHAILAPYNRFAVDPVKVAATAARVDSIIEHPDVHRDEKSQLEALKSSASERVPRGLQTPSIVEIVERINSSSEAIIDLTGDNHCKPAQPLDLLKQIPMKYLHFPEDVRPPYWGTYTKPYTPQEAARLARNPYRRNLHQVDYDYDSEVEWEEPEEGEDLDSEGDDDLDEEGEDDMDGFLDDEEDPQLKRRLINGDLEPVSSGLCWEDARGVSRLNDGSGAISTEFKVFKMGFLLEPHPHSIDPFSTAYWAPEPTPIAISTLVGPGREVPTNGLMNPPRLPLTQRPVNGMLNTLNTAEKANPSSTSKPAKPPKRLIPVDQIPAFKAVVAGSDLTKIALIEALKKKFPKLPKDAISNTLSSVAARVGAKEVDKRWVLLN
ncbi:chromatin assembly factor 1 subunit A-domain-containing protein [Clohesyomyces aquaticus]|uniref:Chromatin assembly factor 1 subunit A-domain-containing protein n=1 Tax=Clohesyomyces aquaticus TaxID=1231657 RepID=A0A1Y2A9D2_9PLEO|nr:chromatin assembly factor 1 subunit A-domain-containing protein [Clohesyomyces aquaticus]